MSKKYTIEDLIINSNIKHNSCYDYSLVKTYIDNKKKIPIICNQHGVFYQSLNSHLKGRGCPICGKQSMARTQALTNKQFIFKATTLHGDKYNYSKVKYINNRTKLIISCNKCNQQFIQTGNDHLDGCGCPNCQYGGFNPNKPALLYYLSINNGQAYKIGITNRTVEQRFTIRELSKITILKLIEYNFGKDAYISEQKILKEFEYAKYCGELLLDSGNNELFKYDVLGFDNE